MCSFEAFLFSTGHLIPTCFDSHLPHKLIGVSIKCLLCYVLLYKVSRLQQAEPKILTNFFFLLSSVDDKVKWSCSSLSMLWQLYVGSVSVSWKHKILCHPYSRRTHRLPGTLENDQGEVICFYEIWSPLKWLQRCCTVQPGAPGRIALA